MNDALESKNVWRVDDHHRRRRAFRTVYGWLLAEDRTAKQRELVLESMKKAATFFTSQIALRGGYVYHYTLDLKTRWGEGKASETQIWVQPPATPTVGMHCCGHTRQPEIVFISIEPVRRPRPWSMDS